MRGLFPRGSPPPRNNIGSSSSPRPPIDEAGECRGHYEGAKNGTRGSCSRLVTCHCLRGWRIHCFPMYVPRGWGHRHKRRCLRHPRPAKNSENRKTDKPKTGAECACHHPHGECAHHRQRPTDEGQICLSCCSLLEWHNPTIGHVRSRDSLKAGPTPFDCSLLQVGCQWLLCCLPIGGEGTGPPPGLFFPADARDPVGA